MVRPDGRWRGTSYARFGADSRWFTMLPQRSKRFRRIAPTCARSSRRWSTLSCWAPSSCTASLSRWPSSACVGSHANALTFAGPGLAYHAHPLESATYAARVAPRISDARTCHWRGESGCGRARSRRGRSAGAARASTQGRVGLHRGQQRDHRRRTRADGTSAFARPSDGPARRAPEVGATRLDIKTR